MSTHSDPDAGRPGRDPRLDFFRGLGLFIILVAHTPLNGWTNWIPGRFGYSDAADIFVFCSGFASALAFGPVFDRHGLAMGTARVLHRVWQIYWAQIAVWVMVAALLVAADQLFGGVRYQQGLALDQAWAHPAATLLGLATLSYVPNYFNILPMYLVILLLLPMVVALAGLSRPVAAAAVVALWLVATMGGLTLPAEPWSSLPWFFNPFAWQLVFFTGFALGRGWLPAPGRDRRLLAAALAVVLVAIPFSWRPLLNAFPMLDEISARLVPLTDKSRYGLFRFVHFLAVAYIAWLAAGPHGRRLRGRVVDAVRGVGQQSLPVFLASLALAQLMGIVLDRLGTGWGMLLVVNTAGFLALLAVARIAGWFKAQPWRRPPPAGRTAAAGRTTHPDLAEA